MYAYKDGQRLYLQHWDYNSLRIMTELAKIVRDNGGRVKPAHTAVISNRSVTESIRHHKIRVDELKIANTKLGWTQKRHDALVEYRGKIDTLQQIDNSPICVFGQQFIRFVVENKMYYYEFDSNPLFDFHYHITKIENNEYSLDTVPYSDNKEWLYDCFINSLCPDGVIKEAAMYIFRMLVNSRDSIIVTYPRARVGKSKVDF